MGRLLWAIQAWYGEMENSERAVAIIAGQSRARSQGKVIGRPKLSSTEQRWSDSAKRAGAGVRYR